MQWFFIVIRNGKSPETPALLLIFSLKLEISGVAVQSIIKTAINDNFCEELLSENDFETVLATFCCYDHGAKASEARSLQIKRSIANAPRVLKNKLYKQFCQATNSTRKNTLHQKFKNCRNQIVTLNRLCKENYFKRYFGTNKKDYVSDIKTLNKNMVCYKNFL